MPPTYKSNQWGSDSEVSGLLRLGGRGTYASNRAQGYWFLKSHGDSMHRLEDICKAMFLKCLVSETAWQVFEASGVKVNDWPRGNTKKAMVKYVTTLREKNFKVARHEAKDLVSLEDVSEDLRSSDNEVLVSLFRAQLREERIEELVLNLRLDRKNAEAHVQKFQERQSDANEWFDPFEKSEELFLRLEEKRASSSLVVEVPGWELLSKAIGGFNPGRVGILMAKTGVGKTAFALNFILNAHKKMRSIFVNMEMLDEDLFQRMLIATNEMDFKDYVTGKVKASLGPFILKAQGEGIIISKGKSLNLNEIRAKCSLENQKKKIGLVIVDYDQKLDLVTRKDIPEWKALQNAVIELEEMAKELKCYVLLLAQEAFEDGKISGSRRSTFSAATVMRLTEINGEHYILADVKNRFGPIGEGVKIKYKKSQSLVVEERQVNAKDVKAQTNEFVKRPQY